MIKVDLVRMIRNKLGALAPILLLYVVLPALIWGITAISGGTDEAQKSDVLRLLHLWIPLFSGWWALMYANDFFSNDGNEIMFLLHKGHHVLASQVCYMVLYLVLLVGSFQIYTRLCPMETTVLWQLLTESIMLCNFTFCGCFLFQNTGASFMLVVIYCVYIIMFDYLHMFDMISIFPRDYANVIWEPQVAGKSLVAGVVFCVAGMWFYCKRRVYK